MPVWLVAPVAAAVYAGAFLAPYFLTRGARPVNHGAPHWDTVDDLPYDPQARPPPSPVPSSGIGIRCARRFPPSLTSPNPMAVLLPRTTTRLTTGACSKDEALPSDSGSRLQLFPSIGESGVQGQVPLFVRGSPPLIEPGPLVYHPFRPTGVSA